MPNRILREGILTSDRVNALSWPAEVFYRRLMSVVDDFGRYYANQSLIRAACYPLRLDRVSNSDIDKWLTECVDAGLVRVYQVEGKSYAEVIDFRQQKRAMTSKFPANEVPPLVDAQQMHSTCVADAQHLRPEAEAEAEARSERREKRREKSICADAPQTKPTKFTKPTLEEVADYCSANKKKNGNHSLTAKAIEVLEFLNTKTGRKYRGLDGNNHPTVNLKLIIDRLKTGVDAQDCKTMIARKHRDWSGDDKMRVYLRPSTLFRASNFEQYLGECVAK